MSEHPKKVRQMCMACYDLASEIIQLPFYPLLHPTGFTVPDFSPYLREWKPHRAPLNGRTVKVTWYLNYLSYQNKIWQTGWHEQQTFIPHSFRGWEIQDQDPGNFLVRTLFLDCRWVPSCHVFIQQREEALVLVLLFCLFFVFSFFHLFLLVGG